MGFYYVNTESINVHMWDPSLVTCMISGNKHIFCYFSLENTTENDNSEQEGEPPFTLHIGMLFTAVCRLVTC